MNCKLMDMTYNELCDLEKVIKALKEVSTTRLAKPEMRQKMMNEWGAQLFERLVNEGFGTPDDDAVVRDQCFEATESVFRLCDVVMGNYRQEPSRKTQYKWRGMALRREGNIVRSRNNTNYEAMINELSDVIKKYMKEGVMNVETDN